MNPLLHMLNIGTLAAWLSVGGFGAVGVIIPDQRREPVIPETEKSLAVIEEIILGEEAPPNLSDPRATLETPTAVPLPAPPDLPELAAREPLPDVPDLPEPAIERTELIPAPKAAVRPAKPNSSPARPSKPAPSGNPNIAETAGSAKPAMSTSSRLAAGRMPRPTYPPAARRQNQTGTVLVEFTVDAAGRVISAYAKSPSPWPLLNAEAVRTVRRWSFPPGGVMKLQRPIVFQLR